jgi:Protein of unknown function (DUF4239)
MSNWLLNLPVVWMAVVIFAGAYLLAAIVQWVVMSLAVDERARAFKALSPGMLPPLGIIFGLLVGFTAAQVWSDFERAKVAVANEASALRSVNLLAASLPAEQQGRLRSLVAQHIDTAVNQEWPTMARQRATLSALPTALIEALQTALAITPADERQRTAQHEIITALESALEARRQRIILSQSSVSALKWAGLLLQALCALIAIAMVHSDNRTTCRVALVLLIAAYSRPFTGEISVGPELLKLVAATHPASN